MIHDIINYVSLLVRDIKKPKFSTYAHHTSYFGGLFNLALGVLFCILYIVGIDSHLSLLGAIVTIGGSGISLTIGLKIGRIKLDGITGPISRGTILDWLLPPGDADYRILELDVAMDRWIAKYGPKRAHILYAWQSVIAVALFWFDRVVVKVLARK